jgi:hypothetical protein
VPSIRNYFYIGGGYADDDKGGHIFRDQMYVEQLKPVNGITQPTPLVIIHGQAQTGTVSLSIHSHSSRRHIAIASQHPCRTACSHGAKHPFLPTLPVVQCTLHSPLVTCGPCKPMPSSTSV